MGAWDFTVMSNDDALDTIGLFVTSKNLAEELKDFLHEKHYVDELLLAVEIVDISLNGADEEILGDFYDYEEWFKSLSENPMEELREDALHVIRFIKKHEEENTCWVADCIKPRRQLLAKIESRLQKK